MCYTNISGTIKLTGSVLFTATFQKEESAIAKCFTFQAPLMKYQTATKNVRKFFIYMKNL